MLSQTAIVDNAGVERVLRAMELNVRPAFLQEMLCAALSNLLSSDAARALVTREGIALLLSAMTSFVANAALQDNACTSVIQCDFNACQNQVFACMHAVGLYRISTPW